jgi:hypothetical protein
LLTIWSGNAKSYCSSGLHVRLTACKARWYLLSPLTAIPAARISAVNTLLFLTVFWIVAKD